MDKRTPSRYVAFSLPYEPPLDWAYLLAFMGQRQTAGVEYITDDVYIRTAAIDGEGGIVAVAHDPAGARLLVTVAGPLRRHADQVGARVRHMFSLDVDQSKVHEALGGDPLIGPLRQSHPGLRIPGAWSPFEALVRTIVGQQVSVAAATTIAGRVVLRSGEQMSSALRDGVVDGVLARVLDRGARLAAPGGTESGGPVSPLSHYFPSAKAVATANLAAIGMPGRRVAALQTVARHVAEGAVPLPDLPRQWRHPAGGRAAGTDGDAVEKIKASLLALPGIGPWTAEFFALRGLGHEDAWPGSDLILRRELEYRARMLLKGSAEGVRAQGDRGGLGPDGRARGDDAVDGIVPGSLGQVLRDLPAGWRPFRAYAALHLWHAAAQRQAR